MDITPGNPTTLELTLTHSRLSPDRLLTALRAGDPPVIARIADDAVRLNPRTLLSEMEITALARCLSGLS